MENNKKQIQKLLEKSACKRNGGICESYEYCRFCEEPTEIFRNSDTPCADAYFDLKSVNKMIKEYYTNIEYVKTGQERIKIWEKEFNKHYSDNDYLAMWYDDLIKSDNYGMPKKQGTYSSPVEIEAIKRENVRYKIKEFIVKEKERVSNKKNEIEILSKVFKQFKDKEKFILDLLLDKYKLSDIMLSYEKKYNRLYSEKAMKNKIIIIKKKIWKNFKKLQKSTLFFEKGVL